MNYFVRSAKGLGVCLAASTVLQAARVDAQYYYQPAPSYYRNDTAQGAVVGGGVGAITGALIGGKKNGEGGALIGAGVGALTGGLIGKSQDNADARQAAVGSTAVARANAQVQAMAVTNYDLVQMTQAGCSEDLIISTIRSRGSQCDLSPQGLIALKQQGVSDRVVITAQTSGGYPAPAVAPAPVYVQPAYAQPVVVAPAPVYYYRPAPVYHFDIGFGHHGHGGHHWHHGHHGHW